MVRFCNVPVFVSVHEGGEDVVGIGAGADE